MLSISKGDVGVSEIELKNLYLSCISTGSNIIVLQCPLGKGDV